MKEIVKENCSKSHNKVYSVINFDSISEIINYNRNTPINKAYKKFLSYNSSKQLSSERVSNTTTKFTQTSCYKEAEELLENGWTEMAQKINDSLKLTKVPTHAVNKTIYDVCGFQACVPRYVQGLPQNMVGSKRVVQKQKTIDLVKSINYCCSVKAQEIVNDSIDTLNVVRQIEAQGIRVNLYVMFCSKASKYNKTTDGIVLKIKSSGERLNINKIAFPMVHPSMLRRIIFATIERHPSYTYGYTSGYGTVLGQEEAKEFITTAVKGCYFIPSMLKEEMHIDLADVKDIEIFK